MQISLKVCNHLTLLEFVCVDIFFYGSAEGIWLRTSCHWLLQNYKAKLINDLDQMAHLTLVPCRPAPLSFQPKQLLGQSELLCPVGRAVTSFIYKSL